ncbi:efflux RND transporter periplasmic adaptor subunit [Methylobacterium sp. NEAU 140]|uniref:efflux RND transporter periplasmic adaptor subunit n=1 Tax=Methylobacterium sp. NEAU 140 TaxID=3064945 RepID=UPI002735C3AD|nr:efflux RND transporter periplasmic adaptor subunit [Methylobacterium sp. NEAU 140]MDP4026940.1 efflux RND transporter periplasmic adaptor subunit [Methylobacterium sp. NEAU 140]
MRAAIRYGAWGVAAVAVLAGIGWLVAGRPSPERMLAHLPLSAEAPPSGAESEPPIGVHVVAARTTRVPISFTYTGTIISQQDAAIQARVTGNVVERPFEPGGHVKKGQVLFRIDPRPFQVALAQAEAQKGQAEAQLTFAQAEVARTDTLADKGYASEQRLQQFQSNAAVAAAQVQAAEASIARQKLNLDYAVVNAPFDGRASLSVINPGDLVIENQTQLVTVVQVDPIDVQMALSSEDSEAVREAMQAGPVTVEVLDEAGKPVRAARIYQLDNRFDPRTARRLVRALLPNTDERFLPGQFVRARVKVGEEEKLLVPTIALSAQLAQQIVYVVDAGGVVQQRPITTGDTFGEETAILDGLKPGDRVVVDHLQDMRQGVKVTVETGTAGTPAAGPQRADAE